MYTKKFFNLYRTPSASLERSHAVDPSQIGETKDLVAGFLASFFFPFIGAAITLLVNRKIMSRYGVMLGFSSVFLLFGIVASFFWILSFICGNVGLLLGLICIFVYSL
jgi:hypothetical protein